MGITNFPNGVSTFGNILYSGDHQQDVSGKAFYVDANVRASGRGRSWDEAYKTIAEGLAASDADIGLSANRAWAKRNTVYYCGDAISETLVLAAEKTDLVGVGADNGSHPRVFGNFTIGTARRSFRIINMGFTPTTTAPVLTFPSLMYGWELHHVYLYKVEGLLNSASLLSTDCRDFVMNNVYCYPDAGAAKNTIGFHVAGTAQTVGHARVTDCYFNGVTAFKVTGTGGYVEGALFKNNVFVSDGLCIDEDSDVICFVDNALITVAAGGSTDGSGVVDWNTEMICQNWVHASDMDAHLPDLDTQA